jgi:hypothetical protein
MPLPKAHLDQLRQDIAHHERDLQELQKGPTNEETNTDIAYHQAVLQLVKDARVEETLGEMNDNPDLIDEFARDPKAYATSHNFVLPEAASRAYGIRNKTGNIVGVEYHIGRYNCALEWKSTSGFSVSQLRAK